MDPPHLHPLLRGRPVRRAAQVCEREGDGQPARVPLPWAGDGQAGHRPDHDWEAAGPVGAAPELPPIHRLDGVPGEDRRGLQPHRHPGQPQQGVPVVADLHAVQDIPGVHPAERDQDDRRAPEGAAGQPPALPHGGPHRQPPVLQRGEQALRMEEARLRPVLLSRCGAGAADVRAAGLEQRLPVQRDGPQDLGAAAARVHQSLRGHPPGGSDIPHGPVQLRWARHRRPRSAVLDGTARRLLHRRYLHRRVHIHRDRDLLPP
mmetsp:Transcript_89802/g.155552  ORF Transcript_89802/g.155552 Transcript_89802/m.155552 type:complete len:261 (+) Transcript_89802:10902-11684(+)